MVSPKSQKKIVDSLNAETVGIYPSNTTFLKFSLIGLEEGVSVLNQGLVRKQTHIGQTIVQTMEQG